MISNGRRTQENAVLLNDVGINDALSYDIGYWTELGPDGTTSEVLSEDFGNGLYQMHLYVEMVRRSDLPAYTFQLSERGERIVHPTVLGHVPPRHLVTSEFLSRYEVSVQVRAFVECYDQATLRLNGPIGEPRLPSKRRAGEMMATLPMSS
jgi:hypothetical protein